MKKLSVLLFASMTTLYSSESIAENTSFCATDCKYEIQMFRKYAKQGSSLAEFNLGIMYLQGKGVERNIENGIRHIQSAAENKEPAAYYQLGYMYLFGLFVEQDITKAKQWLIRADKRRIIGAKKYLKVIESYNNEKAKGMIVDAKAVDEKKQKLAEEIARTKVKALAGDVEVITISGDFNYSQVVEAAKAQSCKTESCGPKWVFVLLPIVKLTDDIENILMGKAAIIYDKSIMSQTA